MDEEAYPAEVQVRAVQGWMAMDLHSALGHEIHHNIEHEGHRSWADWWSELLAEVRRTRPPLDI